MPQNESNGLSGYAKVVQTILTTSGPLALLAIALSVFLMWSVQNTLGAINTSVENNREQMEAARVTMHAFVARQTELDSMRAVQMDLLIKITRQMCINGAKTEMAIRGCLGER